MSKLDFFIHNMSKLDFFIHPVYGRLGATQRLYYTVLYKHFAILKHKRF